MVTIQIKWEVVCKYLLGGKGLLLDQLQPLGFLDNWSAQRLDILELYLISPHALPWSSGQAALRGALHVWAYTCSMLSMDYTMMAWKITPEILHRPQTNNVSYSVHGEFHSSLWRFHEAHATGCNLPVILLYMDTSSHACEEFMSYAPWDGMDLSFFCTWIGTLMLVKNSWDIYHRMEQTCQPSLHGIIPHMLVKVRDAHNTGWNRVVILLYMDNSYHAKCRYHVAYITGWNIPVILLV